MKKIFNSIANVIDVWYNEGQKEGKSGNVFFEDKIIYSYGKHYPLACIYNDFYLVNSERYSNTTAKHKTWILRTLNYDNCLEVPCPDNAKSENNLIYLHNKIKECRKKIKKSIVYKGTYYNYLIECLNNYHLFLHKFYNREYQEFIPNKRLIDKYQKIRDNFYQSQKERTIDNVIIPKGLFKKIKNNTLTPNNILKEKNAQRRAVLLKLYTYEKLLLNTDNKIIHKEIINNIPYELILINTPLVFQEVPDRFNNYTHLNRLNEDVMLLKVKCPSTGTFYVLRVPSEMLRCRQALAWTFGMNEQEYFLEMET